ncbi:HugZ family pyridoxamine 5'-phosphate oxidase [Ferrovibrio xuzhouensis]|uniref:HugZ family protein n=1 Tax=Ferrovibrio xuzhouensis TaxID=1576914 RepID=A0ABV7VDS0_9PROT
MNEPATPARQARAVARACRTATLATSLAGAPYASLVLVAFDLDGAPLLLISRLADHTKNILADGRVSLLCDGTAGFAEPLTGPRASLQGRAEKTDDPRHRARFLARQPSAEMYAGFGDFGFYRIAVERTHLVAGFGRIHWFDDYMLDGDWTALAEAEPEILQHMNADHADAVQLYAARLLGRAGDGWRLCGIDPEGCDLIRGDGDQGRELARLGFARPVADAATARAELVRLVQQARAA